MSTLHNTNNNQSDGCKKCIHTGNNRLGFKNNSKSTPNFFSYNRPLIVEKSEIPISDTTEKIPNTDTIDNKNIR